MHDEAALFQAILAQPDDEGLRLVYADWLEERGDPRAEFIRVQCALAHDPPEPRRAELQARELHLLKKYWRIWNGPLHRALAGTPLSARAQYHRGLVTRWQYRRGFVENIIAPAAGLVRHADLLFRLGPLRHAKLFGVREVIGDLAALPHLERLTSLDLSRNALTFNDLRGLAASPHLGNLSRIDVSGNPIGLEGFQGLETPSFFGRYPSLVLVYQGRVWFS
jgi:uncharacterized protein (TIGR02996 family)